MRTILFLGLLAGGILFACSADADRAITISNEGRDAFSMKTTSQVTTNAQNPHDYSGSVYNVIYEAYFVDSTRAGYKSLGDIEDFAKSHQAYGALEEVPFNADADTLGLIYEASVSDMVTALGYSALSTSGRTSLVALSQELLALYQTENPYKDAYDVLVAYETSLSGNPQLTLQDKKILYITAAVLRNDTAIRKPRRKKDRDWELSIGHIAATAYGAGHSEAEAVVYGLGAAFYE